MSNPYILHSNHTYNPTKIRVHNHLNTATVYTEQSLLACPTLFIFYDHPLGFRSRYCHIPQDNTHICMPD